MGDIIQYGKLPSQNTACKAYYADNVAAELKKKLRKMDPNQDGKLTRKEMTPKYPWLNFGLMLLEWKNFQARYQRWAKRCKPGYKAPAPPKPTKPTKPAGHKHCKTCTCPQHKPKPSQPSQPSTPSVTPPAQCGCNNTKPTALSKQASKVLPPYKDMTSKTVKQLIASVPHTKVEAPSMYRIVVIYSHHPGPLSGKTEYTEIQLPRLHPIKEFRVQQIKGHDVRIVIKHYSGKKSVLTGDIRIPRSFKFTQDPTKAKLVKKLIVS